jgi:hypothetical protein
MSHRVRLPIEPDAAGAPARHSADLLFTPWRSASRDRAWLWIASRPGTQESLTASLTDAAAGAVSS